MACIILWVSVSWKDGKLQICTFTIKSEGLHLCKLWKRTEFSAAKKLWLVSFSKVIFIPRCFVFWNGLFVYQIFFSSLKICNWECCDWKEEKNQSASEVQHSCRSGGCVRVDRVRWSVRSLWMREAPPPCLLNDQMREKIGTCAGSVNLVYMKGLHLRNEFRTSVSGDIVVGPTFSQASWTNIFKLFQYELWTQE